MIFFYDSLCYQMDDDFRRILRVSTSSLFYICFLFFTN